MHNDLDVDRKTSFELVKGIVAENHAVGRRSYGASLKPELRRRSSTGFDETALGYASFAAYLRAAADAGAIDLHKAPRGPDWEAVPPGASVVPAPPVDEGHQFAKRVRADLWSCFVDWRDGLCRVYHRETDRAYMFPAEPREGERPEHAAQRRLYEARRDEYVTIEPIGFDMHVSWMREFAEGVEDNAAREVLLFAVGRDRPAREFTDALDSKPGLMRSWRAERLRRVAQIIGSWATEHGLTIDLFEKRPTRPSLPAQEKQTRPSRTTDDLRELLHRAIERMPESELLRISLPVEYLLGA